MALAAIYIVLTLVDHVASSAFRAGVHATSTSATGTFHWSGVPYLISPETFIYRAGTSSSVGGAWTPWVYAIMLVGAVTAGWLWRLFPAARRRS